MNELRNLLENKRLASQECEKIFSHMLSGQLSDSETAGFLVAWSLLGESDLEILAGVKVLREALCFPVFNRDFPVTDVCGTGGDGKNSFNISTTSAIVAASCGVKIAKHGNRKISSQCGSADLLFALGYPSELSPASSFELLKTLGFCFFFAPQIHTSIQRVMPVRVSLKIPTVFNLMGPLLNPIRPDFQLIGVGQKKYLQPFAQCLLKMGIKRGAVVHSKDGFDEISPCALSDVIVIENNQLVQLEIDPFKLGVHCPEDSLRGGDAQRNVDLFNQLLDGSQHGPYSAVILNTAMILWVSQTVATMEAGIVLAKKALHSSKVRHYFDQLKAQALALASF